jgi:hypothetical protein
MLGLYNVKYIFGDPAPIYAEYNRVLKGPPSPQCMEKMDIYLILPHSGQIYDRSKSSNRRKRQYQPTHSRMHHLLPGLPYQFPMGRLRRPTVCDLEDPPSHPQQLSGAWRLELLL